MGLPGRCWSGSRPGRGSGTGGREAARRLAARPGVASAEPDWIRRVDDCDPGVCWHLQPNQGGDHGANVVEAHAGGARGAGRTVAVVDTGVVAGVADLDNDTGTTGVAPAASIVSYRVDTTGGGVPSTRA
jgi:hypothetical protein